VKTIVFATDGSDSSEEAGQFAREMARETGASLEVVAVRPVHAAGRAGVGASVLEIEEPGAAERVAEAAVAAAAADGITGTAHIIHGDPADEICAAAERLEADLVVIGSRGLGSVSGMLMGSVSRTVVRKCKRPVTVVRSAH
jgi:nucleotide-binding universal stress UspA family protein